MVKGETDYMGHKVEKLEVECLCCWRVEGPKVKCFECSHCSMVACMQCREKC